jgi:tetratricopeptide (TPR) repeat protein
MVNDGRRGESRNVLQGVVSGSTVQADVVHGGVHFHPATPAQQVAAPRQLPAPPVNFVGRAAALTALDSLREERGSRCGLALITGSAGVGKSALALYWSQRSAAHFPDGQLHAELGAFDPDGPVAPGVVLGSFLRSLGVSAERVPFDVAEQAALFRSMTADRRFLILLDDALSAAQVRQLLPSAPGCMVVVTARWRLGGLIGDGAMFVTVEPFDDQEAIELFTETIGARRVDSEPAPALALARLCAGLPIALSVTAARLATRPRWSIGRVLAELSDERRRLASLSTHGDVSVKAAFDLSYRSLAAPIAHCYQAVGLHPGAHVSAAVIAAALDVPQEEATAMLDTLVEINLLGDVSDERYQMHDLVRLHARDQAQDAPDRDMMSGRMAEWYLAGVRAADVLLTPYHRREADRFSFLHPLAVVHADRGDALDWLERERVNLVRMVVESAKATPDLAWLIAYSMWPLFHYRRHHQDRMVVDRVAVGCAQRLGNRSYLAQMLRRLAFAHFDVNEFDEAARLFESSLDLYRQLDDRYGSAAAVGGLGSVALAQRRFSDAAERFTEELAICRELGERRRVALAMLNLGLVANAAGASAQATDRLTEAATLYAELGDLDPYNAARCHIELGRALTRSGEYDASAKQLNRALVRMRELGSPRGQAQARHALGELALATGGVADAVNHHEEALRIYEQLGDREADEVRRLLGLIPPSQADPDRVPQS